jgi:DNA invertase Pin-like site-specific DNA recombinase
MSRTPAPSAIYARLSRDRSGLSENVEIQTQEGQEYAAEIGVAAPVVFSDNDISASRYSTKPREGYERLLAAVRAGRVEVIIVTEMTRLYRRLEELLELIRLAETTPLRAIETTDGSGYNLSTGEGIHNAISAVNNAMLESRKISDRVKRKKKNRAKQGLPDGGSRPYGYEVGGLVIREPEAAVLREAAERAISGEPMMLITRDFNERGITTAQGKLWRIENLQRLLLSKRLIGIRQHHGTEYPAAWPPVLTTEQHELLEIAAKARAGRVKGQPGTRKYLLTGFINCGACGNVMVGNGRVKTKGEPAQLRYRCQKIDNHGREVGCGVTRRVAVPLDQFVAEAVLHRFDSPEVAAALAPKEDEEKVRRLITQYDARKRKLDELVDDYYAGDLGLTREQFARGKAAAEAALAELRDEVARLQGQQVLGLVQAGQTIRDAWEASGLGWRRSLIQLIVEQVVVHPGHPGSHTWRGFRFNPEHVEVRWKV